MATEKTMVYDDVDYDYPSCGGIKIYRGRKWWTIITESNYQGNYTDGRYQALIDDDDTPESVADDFNRNRDDFICRSRGFLVQ